MITRGTGNQIKGIKGRLTLAWRGWLVLAAVSGALCLASPPAAADTISFNLDSALLDYAGNVLTVTENTGSDLQIRQDDGSGIVDTAELVGSADGGSDFDFLFTLDMVNEAGDDQWSATGTMSFTDKNTASYAVVGDFESTSVFISNLNLWIVGELSNDAPSTSILQNRGDPWVFAGDITIPNEHAGDGLDGAPGQITVANPGAYDEGAVFVLKVGVSTSSPDTLFGSDFANPLAGGEVVGSITPEPSSAILLLTGLTVVVRRRRRLR